MKRNKHNMYKKEYLYITLVFFVGLLFVLFLFVYRDIKIHELTSVINRNRTNRQNAPPLDVEDLNLNGEKKVSVTGVVQEKTNSNELVIATDNNRMVRILITEETLIGQQWEQVDEDGDTIMSYDTLSLNEAVNLINEGTSIKILYSVRTYNNGVYTVEEAVIL